MGVEAPKESGQCKGDGGEKNQDRWEQIGIIRA